MARTKAPKKNVEVSETIPNAQPVSTGVAAAAPAMEAQTKTVKTNGSTKKAGNGRRAYTIPSNVDEEIRQLAYLFSERRGFEPGHETEDWLNAEHEVLQRYHQHSA
jgi:DUF2934 family protein